MQITPPHLEAVLDELKSLEPIIYAANAGKTSAYFEALLAPEFWEIAASGKRYNRTFVLKALTERQQNPFEQTWETTDYFVQQLSDELFLITYTLHQPTRVSERTSLWRKHEGRWQFVYHQGTTSKQK